jgi:CO dehydrogenase maturation factor
MMGTGCCAGQVQADHAVVAVGAAPRRPGATGGHDADINQHLAEALSASQQPPLGGHLTQIKEYLRGTNPRISSAAAMVKTTPPGRGSRLPRHGGPDPVHELGADTLCGARLLATGPFEEDDLARVPQLM